MAPIVMAFGIFVAYQICKLTDDFFGAAYPKATMIVAGVCIWVFLSAFFVWVILSDEKALKLKRDRQISSDSGSITDFSSDGGDSGGDGGGGGD